jgi:transcription initiation factor TFIID subunit 13
MLRRDAAKLGRISELIAKDKEMKAQRKAFNTDEGAVVKGGPKEDGEAKGRGKKRERGDEDDEGSLISGVGADGGKGLKKKKRKKKADGDAEGSVAGSARGR